MLPSREAPDDGDHRGGAGDRRDERDRARRHAAVEGDEPRGSECRREAGPEDLRSGRAVTSNRNGDGEEDETDGLRGCEHRERGQDAGLDAAAEVAQAPGEAGREGEERWGQRSGTGRVAAAASSAFAW